MLLATIRQCEKKASESRADSFWKKFALAGVVTILRQYFDLSKPLLVKSMREHTSLNLDAAWDLSNRVSRAYFAQPELLVLHTNGSGVSWKDLLATLEEHPDEWMAAECARILKPTFEFSDREACHRRGRKRGAADLQSASREAIKFARVGGSCE
jgi:hypothetical protein